MRWSQAGMIIVIEHSLIIGGHQGFLAVFSGKAFSRTLDESNLCTFIV